MYSNIKRFRYQAESLNDYVDDILSSELNRDTSNKLINKIDDDINFKYNSFNICIGKQSTGKTTSVLKEFLNYH